MQTTYPPTLRYVICERPLVQILTYLHFEFEDSSDIYTEEQNKLRIFSFMKQMSTFQRSKIEIEIAAIPLTLIVQMICVKMFLRRCCTFLYLKGI